MAKINNIYVFVSDESIQHSVTTTSHPTEKGLPVSDTIRKEAKVIDITGKIVDAGKVSAETAISKIKALQQAGSLITYVGQAGTFKNFQIQSFNPTYNNKNYGGADFSMTLQEVRTAKSAYVKKVYKVETKNGTLRVGDTVKFLGGSVYVSSDATKPSATRGVSICILTKISTYSWSKHNYHLISVDGRLVYGWVDKDKVKPRTTTVSSSTNGGTQQVKKKTVSICHKVHLGDTLYKLVNQTYKSYNLSITEIMETNPDAFRVKNDPTTLQVGATLLLTGEK